MTTFLRRWFRPLAAVVALLGLGFAAYAQRDAIAAFDWSADPLALLGAVGLFAVAPCLQALTWVWALRRGGAGAPSAGTLRVWARSFLLRYEPSGVVGFAYRVHQRERVGATTPQVLAASAYEQLASVVGGALVAVAGFALAGLQPPTLAWALAAGAVAVAVAARPAFLGRWAAGRLAARGIDPAVLLPGRVVGGMVLVQALGWAATGLGAWLLVRALGASVDAGLLLGAFALSWLLGVLVPLAPGGLGLRDGSLVLSLTASVGTGVATALALALRLVSFAGELVAVLVLELAALALARAGATESPAVTAVAEPIPEARRTGTLVVVPTFNEAEMLPLFVARFAATGLELLVVDDGSPDGTGALADILAAERPWMHVLHRQSKGRAGDGLPRGLLLGARARVLRDRADGLRPLPPAREARRARGRAPRRGCRPRHRQPLPPGRRHPGVVARAAHAEPRGVHGLEVRARASLRGPLGRLQALAGEHPGRARLRRDARRGLRVPG